MKKLLVALSAVAVLAACSGKGEGVADPNNGELAVESSSSVEQGSSSSEKAGSSSGSVNEGSSGSGKQSMSSSGSVDDVNCSDLLKVEEGKAHWCYESWFVPKECRFNPDIDYGTLTDNRDGQVYRTVKIGDQTWMAENLNYYDSTNLSVKKKSWCYGYSANGNSYACGAAGRLYTWAAAIDSVKLMNDAKNPLDCGYGKNCGLAGSVQGVCPSGWHLPDTTEWKVLFSAVGGISTAGKVLKSPSAWRDMSLTDAFGFSALPAGYRSAYGSFKYAGYDAYFWSAVERDGNNGEFAYNVNLGDWSPGATLAYNFGKFIAVSVRCVKD